MFVWRHDPGPDGVGVAFTDGELALGDAQPADARAAGFGHLSGALGVPVAITTQVHGAEVRWVGDEAPSAGLVDLTAHRADALLTTRRGLGLAVRVADCVPVLLADRAGTVVAAAHAGRAGLLAGILDATVTAMEATASGPLRAWVGPHICATCYEVPPAMAADAAARLRVDAVTTRWGTPGIDLGGAVRRQLRARGVSVEEHAPCTLTQADLPSHRGGSSAAERLVGVIWLASDVGVPRAG